MLNRTIATNLTPVAITATDTAEKNTPTRVTETILSGLEMLSLTQNIAPQRLLKVATAMAENVSQNERFLAEIHSQAMTQLINPLFENRNLMALIAKTR